MSMICWCYYLIESDWQFCNNNTFEYFSEFLWKYYITIPIYKPLHGMVIVFYEWAFKIHFLKENGSFVIMAFLKKLLFLWWQNQQHFNHSIKVVSACYECAMKFFSLKKCTIANSHKLQQKEQLSTVSIHN